MFGMQGSVIMKTREPVKSSSGDWIVLLPRIFVCGAGAFFVGYGIYDYFKDGHYLSVLIYTISFGLLLACLGLFTSEKTCETIADSIISGF